MHSCSILALLSTALPSVRRWFTTTPRNVFQAVLLKMHNGVYTKIVLYHVCNICPIKKKKWRRNKQDIVT